MKKITLLIVFTFCCVSLFAQQNPNQTSENPGVPKAISGGVLNGKATSLPKPSYPAAAKAVRAGGAVSVQVTIDEEGNVISAAATSGHPLLRQASEQAARGAKFSPTRLSGTLVKITGVIVYNFVPSFDWLSIGALLGSNNIKEIEFAARELPPNFTEERKRILTMVSNQSPSEADDLISLIETRLGVGQPDLWEFQVGTTVGRIIAEQTNDNSLRTNLLKLRQLTDFPPTTRTSQSLGRLNELANFSNSQKLSEKDKATIIELCNAIR
jgi:TonB family protein